MQHTVQENRKPKFWLVKKNYQTRVTIPGKREYNNTTAIPIDYHPLGIIRHPFSQTDHCTRIYGIVS
ncbi:MAG TPA: hypothetical protein VH396_15245 [Chitinophagaceae bacterium]